MSKVDLLVDWCSYEAAKYAAEHWHYRGTMPTGKLVKIGIWEHGKFIGVVIFSRGSNDRIGSRYKLSQMQICELTRVALREHFVKTSSILARCFRLLKKQSPGLRLVVSYADPTIGHIGILYQASNLIYVGKSNAQRALYIGKEWVHKQTAHKRWGTASVKEIRRMTGRNDIVYGPIEWRYTYLYPLDRAMRRQIEPLRQPYPKRAGVV